MGERQSPLEGVVIRPESWIGRRVLITGHTGFKGGWLSLMLQRFGAEVTGYALPAPTDPSLFETSSVGTGMRSVIADVRDLGRLEACFREARPEVVFHLAAQPLVRQSYEDPVETYSTNVMGTVSVLEIIRRVGGVRGVVIVTSDKCYENREWVWGYRERDRMGGYDPYSNSKGCAELVTAAFRSSFFNPRDFARHGVALASARAGNVIGGGDWAADRLVPDIVRALATGEPVRIRNPKAIRPWQHVLESVGGYVHLAAQLLEYGPRFAEGWNFGPDEGDTLTVAEVVGLMVARWGEGAAWALDQADHPHEAHYLKLDCSKARTELAWRPRLPVAAALEWTVAWYKAWRGAANMRDYTLGQIEDYLGREAT